MSRPFLAIALAASCCLAPPHIAAAQSADILKTDLLAVFAHPDDEISMAATLAEYAQGQGKRVVAVYFTRGEGGGNMVGRQWGPSLGLLRESELRACLSVLGVERVYFLDQVDWAYTESAQMTLEKWDTDKALERLIRLLRVLRPEVLVTLSPIPAPGQHGHHQACGRLAVEAFHHAADAQACPHQLEDEGLEPWQTRKLYTTAKPEPYGAAIASDNILPNGRTAARVAGEALSRHRSQGFGGIAGSPWLNRPCFFCLLKSAVGFYADETDLFRGLDRDTPLPAVIPLTTPPISPLVPPGIRFQSRPSVERFREWALAMDLPDLVSSSDPDVPCVAGGLTTVYLAAHNPAAGIPSELRLEIADGWSAKVSFQQTEQNRLSVEIRAPAGAQEDTVLRAIGRMPDGNVEARLILHPVPKITVPCLNQAPSLGAFVNSEWEPAAKLEIPHTRIWEGRAESDRDSSASAWIGYTSEALWIRLDVRDDRVVSNIAPNDIRGHWRSDSVEICIDPSDGAEHTLGTFKVGIFPFDTSGHVRASRDADANQGPVERTAQGLRLSSHKTADGYRIIAAVSWSDVPLRPGRGIPLAFNLLIYDGDKADAAIGENINESRLAWSPRRGIQGRPEDWGRIILE